MRKIIEPCGFHCIKINNLGVQFSDQVVLHDINLHIHCGSFNVIIGKNGAGKSTLIKAILDDIPHTGTIEFKDTKDGHMAKLKIGYVPQSPAFDPSDPVSVADLFACCMSKRPAFLGLGKAMRALVLECLERVHGEGLINRRVGTLSGGELQRVLLALALEPLPNILILDEPLSGVDVEGMETLMDMLDEIRKNYDLSILMTTHDFSMLPRYANQVVLIDRGVLIQGDPEAVLGSPEFAQTFHIKGGRA